MHDRRCLSHDDRALGIGLFSPGLKTSRGGRDFGLELFVRQLIELFKKLSMLSLRMSESL
jgi:hypothetical protein